MTAAGFFFSHTAEADCAPGVPGTPKQGRSGGRLAPHPLAFPSSVSFVLPRAWPCCHAAAVEDSTGPALGT